jgi:uncharacterized protein (DUF2062 family)
MTETISAHKKGSKPKICVLLPLHSHFAVLKCFIEKSIPVDVILLYDSAQKQTDESIIQDPDCQNIYLVPVLSFEEFKTGLQYAKVHNYDYAITLPSEITDIERAIDNTIQLLSHEENILLIGKHLNQSSPETGKTMLPCFLFWTITGCWLSDPWSEFCAYPLHIVPNKKQTFSFFPPDTILKIIIAWEGASVISIPVSSSTNKLTSKQKRKFIANINLSLLMLAPSIVWYRPVLYLKNKGGRELFFNPNETVQRKVFSISFGVFMGIVPIWGFQMLTAMALSFVFKLNKPLVLIFSNISFPPFIPFIVYLSMLCGKFWFNSPTLPKLSRDLSLETIKPYLEQYIWGSVTLATIAAVLFGSISFFILTLMKKRSNLKL